MTQLTISSKGWVVIPAAMRAKYGMKPGAHVRIIDYGGVLSILPAFDDPIEASAGILKARTSLTRAVVAEHVKERGRDRKR